MSNDDRDVVLAVAAELNSAPEGECEEASKLTQAEAERQVADHAPCRECGRGFTFRAYACPDWRDHWHVAHSWRSDDDKAKTS